MYIYWQLIITVVKNKYEKVLFFSPFNHEHRYEPRVWNLQTYRIMNFTLWPSKNFHSQDYRIQSIPGHCHKSRTCINNVFNYLAYLVNKFPVQHPLRKLKGRGPDIQTYFVSRGTKQCLSPFKTPAIACIIFKKNPKRIHIQW